MKKKILFTLVLSLLITSTAWASPLNGDYKGNPIVRIEVDGHTINSEVPAQIIHGSTLLPLRAVSDALGGEVMWNPNDYSVTVTQKEKEISFKHVEDEPLYFVNDEPLHFLHKNVDPYSVILTNRDKTITYQKNVDYRLENLTILRISSGKIQSLESVLLSYSFVETKQPDYNTNESAVQKTIAKLRNRQPVNIVFIGDSTTEQNMQTQGFDNHVKQVENELKKLYPSTEIHVYNKGVSSQTAGDGLKRFQKDVLDLNPDLTIICFGINDFYYSLSQQEFGTNMEAMMKTLIDQNKEVVIRSPDPIDYSFSYHLTIQGDLKNYNETTKKLALKYNAGYCDIFTKFEDVYKQGLTSFPDLTTDKVHPNARAQILITDELMKFFK